MRLTLQRKCLRNNCTTGDLLIDGRFECHTLEDVVRKPGTKVWGATAIAAGVYKVIINFSNRFQRQMPRLLNVPSFTGILIHSGNNDTNTEGCILVGYKITDKNTIALGTSKVAYTALFNKLEQAIQRGEDIFIEILDQFPEDVVE